MSLIGWLVAGLIAICATLAWFMVAGGDDDQDQEEDRLWIP